jgi:hypothetical protein
LGAIWELARYALRFGWALLLPKAFLAARVLAAESQLAVELDRSGASRRRSHQFTPAFRLLWVAVSKLVEGWENLAHLMKPETVKRWHTMRMSRPHDTATTGVLPERSSAPSLQAAGS